MRILNKFFGIVPPAFMILLILACADHSDIQNSGSGSSSTGNSGNYTAVISLNGNTAEYSGANVKITKSDYYGVIIEISNNGTYAVQGSLNHGFVAVSKKDLDVTIILNGANINCKNYAALVCLKKSNVTLVLADNTTNYLTDGGEDAKDGSYDFGYDDEEKPNAALLIRRDLTIRGSGKLIVKGNANNGIGSRANLRIEGGDISVNAAYNAIKGNDSVTITGGSFNLVSGNDGIKTEETDDGLGAISISGSTFVINSGRDSIQAGANLSISSSAFTISTAGGSSVPVINDSAKGMKAGTDLIIHSGTFVIDSNDDCMHSDGNITINNGNFTLSSGDDAIHADERLTVNGGTINILKCYEGLEAYDIDLNGGFIKIIASDDGINIAGGKDSSVNNPGGGWRPGEGGFGGGRPGGGAQVSIIDGTLTITGGEYCIESGGDGLDSNGYIVMTGGTVVIFGPTSASSPDVPIDYDRSFTMSDGLIAGLGNNGQMLQQPNSSASSGQYSFLAKFGNSPIPAGSLICISSSSGTEIITIRALGDTRSLVLCSPLLNKGTYKILAGGSHSGSVNALGLYQGGTYSGGSVIREFNISNMSTVIN